ncbi:translational repressor protein [Serratia phage Muldoon]|uniref:Translation repressor protein n=1 Tax=Serratia phage Muldoon TaxID=2601678 RepID=A0A5P8PH76_9CAUD|nr:translation repressor [Serratia phage Muldoon]QFR56005.1 translational repressor protein [Serratia phage Muldoon]WDS61592.1 endoribonuclease translational repressor of early genes [Cronobacter phage vB_Cdu_VP8]
MLQIELIKKDDFLKIRETLTRMGIANNKTKTLYQSCHILQKQGLYYVVHFKELLKLDGRPVEITDEDFQRRDSIAQLLEQWNLCRIVHKAGEKINEQVNNFRVISHKQKDQWNLVHKYKIGN